MSERELAKVDYLKPLEEKPYAEVVAERAGFRKEVKEKIARIVGEDLVTDDADVLARYSRDRSHEPEGRPAFVVFPKNTEQVCNIMKLANELLLPLVPVSSGTHNYGCTIPRMGGIVIELSRWKKIHNIDYRNRAVRIDPGVTYDELQKALTEQGLRALMPLLPRKDQSVLTAHLEAQPMMIPEFNYSEPLYTAEIVLPGGEIFRTGSAAPAPPETINTDMVGPWGPGFDWNRLYTRAQGTLGIITWANIMAEPLPTMQKIYYTAFDSLDELISFTYQVQRKWIGYECFGLNGANLAYMLADSMPDDYRELKRKLPHYVQLFCIGGLKRFPEERIAYQEADFFEIAAECGVKPELTIPKVPKAASFFEKHLRCSWEREIYWKDTYKGACADIFFLIPMDRIPLLTRAIVQEAKALQYSTEDIGIYIQPIENGRAAHLEFTLPYNPKDNDECILIKKLHRLASRKLYTLGAHFTRAYGAWAEMVSENNAVQYQTTKLIKEMLDPNNIMNPGKLGL
jgi:FAD/FMN-containing dehydrogenase